MNLDLVSFAEQIKNFKFAYLAGGIQHKANPDGWRQDLTSFLEKNKRTAINPFADNEKIFNPSVMGYKSDGSVNSLDDLLRNDEGKWAYLLKQTEENDMYFIAKSDIVIFYLDSSAGFGTYTEFKETVDKFKKPFIIVRNISRNALPHWIASRRYFSLVKDRTAVEFKSLSDMKEFFVKHLNFKI
jgi:hypothetical protein